MEKAHVLASRSETFRISPKLQEMLCVLGQGYVFEEGEEILAQTLGIAISAKQIQKVSEHYGEQLEERQRQYTEFYEQPPRLGLRDENTPVYAMVDGSMVYTREEGWKEIKAGRIFAAADCVQTQPSRRQIVQSHYLCHLGGHQDFTRKYEPHLDGYKNKIFIADGAVWIWKWLKEAYPDAVQILDYYHAVEKLAQYAAHQYSESEKRKAWLEEKKQQLLNNEASVIIAQLKRSIARNKEAEKAQTDVIRYYENNLDRMQYKTFKEKGYLIGSGAIESAHRNIIQQRLKLSGQRWSIRGAQQIVNLRACKKSNQWQQLSNMLKKAA